MRSWKNSKYGPKVSDVEWADLNHICVIMDDGSIHVVDKASPKVTCTWNQRNQTSEGIFSLIFSIRYNVKVNQKLCVVSFWINIHSDDIFEHNDEIQTAFLHQLHVYAIMCLHVLLWTMETILHKSLSLAKILIKNYLHS